MASVYKSAGLEAARIAGLDSEMDRAASKVLARIEHVAARHADTGDFARSFRARKDMFERRGVLDRVVESTDPAALAIEYGHMTRRSKKRRLRKWVPGLRIVNEAVDSLR